MRLTNTLSWLKGPVYETEPKLEADALWYTH